ncbi:hypothetical protein HO133_009703 [Letharia lupina]|uniref:Cyclin-like protein n=1 Tax=Letharia lupina TaxID=560253 RepID=A0A8H6CLG2_9LECA|nr:uncharacterized protein HO133_009703 [Letharia lupina]KAF6225703.1 hypothetical protein HO133_009703 [Letharia lupina]
MPLTPPDHYDAYPSSAHATGQLPAIHTLGQIPNYELGGLEGQEVLPRYSQYTLAPISRHAYLQENNRHGPSNYANLQGAANSYAASSVPLLPPIRVPDRSLEDYQHHGRSNRAPSAPSVPQPKEEKAVGGVAVHLDYEMEDMVDFVSKMAQGIVLRSESSVHSDFRKYVSQILSSTRLPSSTILLGLHYLAERMTLLSNSGKYNHGSGQVYRMLTTALVLGSKFLDDNTFQNRSWSEVSSIPVCELNVLEVEWLMDIKWNMHINPDDPEGFLLWHQRWQAFKANKVDVALAESLEQTHIGVSTAFNGNNVQRQRSLHQRSSPTDGQTASYLDHQLGNGYKNHVHSQWNIPRYDQWPPLRSQTDYSPPETGPTTPEWYTHGGFGYGHAPQQAYPAMKVPPPLQVLGSNALQSNYYTAYAQQYIPHGHGITCGCGYCGPHYERYSMAPSYGPQAVVG